MGFLGDMFGDMLSNSGVELPFGTRFRKNDANFEKFYDMIHLEFGLTSRYRLQENERVPVSLSVGFDDKPYSFEVRGIIHHPSFFLSRGGILDVISRELPISPRKAWAFDITRIHEGILKGSAEFTGDNAYAQSEESLKILRIVHAGIRTPLSSVPGVTLEFGTFWSRFGIPDQIHFIVESMYPFNDAEFLRTVNLISHNYRHYNAPVQFSYSGNPATGTMSITAKVNVEDQPPAPPQPPTQPQQPERAATPQTDPDDGFPYDFYRGLGLINADNSVTISTILGPMNVIMDCDIAREHLLNYKPEN